MALEIVVKAKNLLGQGLGKAGASIKKFSENSKKQLAAIGGFFKKIGIAVAAVGGALVAFGAKAVSAYAVQEAAEKKLSSALKANGENVDALMPKYKALAAEIQDITGIADEATIAMMGQMSTLGVTADKMEEAIKAQIAFGQAGMGSEQAIRAAALAVQGNYDMLKRYIPALRTATSEGEEQAIVQDLIKRGFEQQEAQLGTTAGSWNALKGRIGDAWEEAGKAIVENTSLSGVLVKLGDKVKELTQRFSDFSEGGGIDRAIMGVKIFANDFALRIESIKIRFEAVGKWIGEAGFYYFDKIRVAAVNAFSMAGTAISNFGDNAKIALDNAKNAIFGIDDRTAFKSLTDGANEAAESFASVPSALLEAETEIMKLEEESAKRTQKYTEDYDKAIQARIDKKNEEAARMSFANDEINAGLDARDARLKEEEAQAKKTAEANETYNQQLESIAEVFEKMEGTDGTITDFILAVKAIENSLSGVKLDLSGLADLESLSDINLSSMSQTDVNKYVRAIKALEQGLKDVKDIQVPQGLSQLADVDLKSMSTSDANKYVRAIKILEQGLKDVKLPDLGKQINLDALQADSIKNMADALGKLEGKDIKLSFADDVSTAIKNTASNTKSIKDEISGALKLA